MVLFVLSLAVLIGFALGHFSFRVKGRWCRRCGLGLVCPDCVGVTRAQVSTKPATTPPFGKQPAR
jgi:hypothetical protein